MCYQLPMPDNIITSLPIPYLRCLIGLWRLWLSVLCCLLSVQVQAVAVDYERQSVALAMTSEPPNLDSAKSSDQVSHFVLSHINEGLLQYDVQEQLIGGVAKRWELSETHARFWLRDNAKWSDGKALTAADFVYAWRRAVDPATASSYAYILFPVKNAQAINRGEKPPHSLGIRAVNAHEIIVELEKPCAYFLSLTAFVTYFPQRQDFVEKLGRNYAAEAGNLLFNGPYTLDKWVHGAALMMRRNPYYWRQQDKQLRQIAIEHVTSDLTAQLNLFKNNEIALADLDADTLGAALQGRLPIQRYLSGSFYFLRFNFRDGRVTANHTLRQAIQAVVDSDSYVNKVVGQPGILPGRSLFPMTVKGSEGLLREEYPAPQLEINLDRARSLLAQAKKELQVDVIPPLVLLCTELPATLRQAEYLQNLLKITLGLELRIDRQIAKQRFARERAGEFDLVLSGWGPDYDDAMTFADLFASWNKNNRGAYANAEYDHWVEVAQNSVDAKVRAAAFSRLQQIIFTDVVILPLYESAITYVVHPQLQGAARMRFSGDLNLRFAWIARPE
jgi:oligopeptide transport system substrate-binding protein